MSVGTLYTSEISPRAKLLEALVKYFKLDVDVVDTKDFAQFAELFPLKKVPAFVDAKGYKLSELIAIAYYCKFTLI